MANTYGKSYSLDYTLNSTNKSVSYKASSNNPSALVLHIIPVFTQSGMNAYPSSEDYYVDTVELNLDGLTSNGVKYSLSWA